MVASLHIFHFASGGDGVNVFILMFQYPGGVRGGENCTTTQTRSQIK
jgi:hypothetical protein